MSKRVVVFGPGPKFKGGMSNYTTSLAKAFDKIPDTEVHLVSWTQQYPAIIPRDFIDKASRKDLLEGTNIQVEYITNYNNPFSWKKTYQYIRDLKPDIVIFQWSIAIQGLPLGYIAKRLAKHSDIEVLFDLHFVIQKEQSNIDLKFTKRGIKHANSYIVHAYKTYNELTQLFPNASYEVTETGQRTEDLDKKTVIKLYHPVYDMFEPDSNFDLAKTKEELKLKKHVFLFFGFIRKYKGLHHAINAFAKVAQQRDDVSLLIVGEAFWQTLDETKLSTKIKKALFGVASSIFLKKKASEDDYRPLELIQQHGIADSVTEVIEYVSNEEVPRYFQVSDSIILFYEYATPSGVESMAYNFNMPILATKVGHFPETVKDGFNGYLAEAENTDSMAEAMLKAIDHPIDRNNVSTTAQKMSWENYAKAILQYSNV